MDDKALDTGRTCPVRHGVKSWRWRVTCWEPRASFRVQRALQAILGMEWSIPGTDATQLLTVWTDQVKDYEQQYSNKTVGGVRSSCNSRTHDERDLMAAEIQAAAVCQVRGERGQSAKDCWYHAIKGCEKGQRQGTRTKDEDDKRKGVCNNCEGGGESASNCLKERESSNASYSGGGDPLCLTYTDDQFQWITTMENWTCGGTVEHHRAFVRLWCCMSGAAVQDDSWLFL